MTAPRRAHHVAMTSLDYVLDIALIAIVIVQIRGRRLSPLTLVLPLVIVAWVASSYLHGVPTAGNDLELVALGAGSGLVLGTMCGLTTFVTRRDDGRVFVKAGVAAAIFWVLGVGARFAFQLYVTHGGDRAIGRFSVVHHITSGEAWTACIILMAIGEVAARSGIIAWRAYRLAQVETVGIHLPARESIMELRDPAT